MPSLSARQARARGSVRMSATMDRATTASANPSSPFNNLPPLEGFSPATGENPAVTKNNHGNVWVPQMARPRRNRKSPRDAGASRSAYLFVPSNVCTCHQAL